MKKVLFFGILTALASAAFAQTEPANAPQPGAAAMANTPAPAAKAEPSISTVNAQPPKTRLELEATVNLPVHETDTGPSRTVINGLAAGLALTIKFPRYMGITFEGDVAFNKVLSGEPDPGSLSSIIMSANGFLGPILYAYDGENLKVPFAAGAHYFYSSHSYWDGANITSWEEIASHQIGFGVYLGVQYHFNERLYLLSRVTISYDIVRYDADGISFVRSLGVKPAIGIGVKF